MFDHVTIHVSDRAASERFYETVLATLGIEKTHSGKHYAEWDDFTLAAATQEKQVTRRLHVAFFAPSRGLVDEFWRTGIGAGLRRRRRARPAPAIQRQLLRRLPARPRRQ